MSLSEPAPVRIALEPAAQTRESIDAATDRRPRLPEPPPVFLMTVEDASLPAPSGIETELEWFYRDVLAFAREPDTNHGPIFKASNFRLHFTIVEPPIQRENLHPLGITVDSLFPVEAALVDREYPYVWQKGLSPGSRSILLLDPAGNWIELVAAMVIR